MLKGFCLAEACKNSCMPMKGWSSYLNFALFALFAFCLVCSGLFFPFFAMPKGRVTTFGKFCPIFECLERFYKQIIISFFPISLDFDFFCLLLAPSAASLKFVKTTFYLLVSQLLSRLCKWQAPNGSL